MRTIHRDIVAGLIISSDGQLLFGMKDPNGGGVYADCWHTPGGGVEAGETKVEALAREMQEEMGLDIRTADVTLLDDKGSGEAERKLKGGEVVTAKMKFYVYKITFDKPAKEISVTPGDDIQTYIWADPKKLRSYKLTPPSVELFARLGWM